MSTTTSTCFHLHCDAKLSDECEDVLKDDEFESTIHFRTPTEAVDLATTSYYWVKVGEVMHCIQCKRVAAEKPHPFVPEPEYGGSVCSLCDEWATEGPHGIEVVPGQLELSTVEPDRTLTAVERDAERYIPPVGVQEEPWKDPNYEVTDAEWQVQIERDAEQSEDGAE